MPVDQLPAYAALASVAAVFGVSGVLKLRCPQPLAGSLLDLGLSAPIVRVTARALPVVEVLLAALALVAEGWLRLVALSAVAAVLLGGILLALVRRPDAAACGCFGPGSTNEPRRVTIARNAVLLAVVAAAASVTGDSMFGSVVGDASVTIVLLGSALGSLLLLHLHLRSLQQGRLAALVPRTAMASARLTARAQAGLERTPRTVEDLQLSVADGRRTTLSALCDVRPQAFVVVSPDCSMCEQVVAALPEAAASLADTADVRALVLTDLCSAPRHLRASAGAVFVTDETEGLLWAGLAHVVGTPSTVVVDRGLQLVVDGLTEVDLDSLQERLRARP